MSDDQLSDGGPLTDAELASLEADLGLLMRADQAPALSAALSARILADAADAVPVAPQVRTMRVRATRSAARPGLVASVLALWRPMSAGLAAAALGVWLGWSDPAGMTLYAQGIITSDLADPGGEVVEPADLFDLEL